MLKSIYNNNWITGACSELLFYSEDKEITVWHGHQWTNHSPSSHAMWNWCNQLLTDSCIWLPDSSVV